MIFYENKINSSCRFLLTHDFANSVCVLCQLDVTCSSNFSLTFIDLLRGFISVWIIAIEGASFGRRFGLKPRCDQTFRNKFCVFMDYYKNLIYKQQKVSFRMFFVNILKIWNFWELSNSLSQKLVKFGLLRALSSTLIYNSNFFRNSGLDFFFQVLNQQL